MPVRPTSRVVVSLCVILLHFGSAERSAAQAVRETARLDESYMFSFVNPCTGEALVLHTHVKTYVRMMTDGSGGTHFHFNGRWQYRAVSEATGVEYVGTETGNWSMISPSGGGYNETYVSHGHLIGKGPADNLHIKTFFKVTVTPKGKVSTETFEQTVDCRG